jgi:hypothetical protein
VHDGSGGLFSCFHFSIKAEIFATASSHCLVKVLVPRFHIFLRPVSVDSEAVCPPFFWKKNEGSFAEKFHRFPVNETWLLCEDAWLVVISFWWMEY